MFKKVYLEISNICNLQCSFCHETGIKKEIMNLVEFENILQQVVPFTEKIYLHLLGEPLAHPQFLKILDICKKHKAKIDLTTNGVLIDRYKNDLINSESIRQINFSLHVFKDNFSDKDIEPYLLPIFEFVKSAHENRPELYTNFRLWNQDSNDSDNEDIFTRIESYFKITINRNIEVGAIKSKKLWNRLYLNIDSRFEWPSFSLPNKGTQGRCYGTVDHIGIHASGSVVPCCLDKNATIVLGNVKEELLEDILNGDRFTSMRDGFINGVVVEKLCQHCSFKNRFGKMKKATTKS